MSYDPSNQVTPLKREERNFSPVVVSDSPVSRTPQKGNLTGNPRKIRDSAADLYNLIQEWNSHCISSYEVLLKINTIKIGKVEHGEPENIYPEGLQVLCDQLDTIYKLMHECVHKMLTTKTEIGGVVKLEVLKNSSDVPMFLTWPAHHFGDVWTVITDAYEQELALKTYIKENIAHTAVEDLRLFYTSAWINQPYIHSKIDITVEALLKETGHR